MVGVIGKRASAAPVEEARLGMLEAISMPDWLHETPCRRGAAPALLLAAALERD